MSEPANDALDEVNFDFQTLCTPHYPALLNYANRLLPGRPAEAKDLVQTAFLRAFRTWESWRPKNNEDASRAARGWLHRIVQNVFRDESRAHVLHRDMLDDHHERVIENTYGVEADHLVQEISDGVGDEVRAALEVLDPKQREIVERADFHGEQYKAIAEAMGIPLGTVMSSLHRGRKILEARLKNYARRTYGISRKEIGVKAPRRRRLALGTESDCTGAAALADVASETPEPEPDRVNGVMAGDHDCDLLDGESRLDA